MKQCPTCQNKYADKLSYCPLDGERLTFEVARDRLVGHIIDHRYRIDAPVGEGGIGVVYLAHHEKMPRKVALKILRSEFTTHEELVARFQREVQTIVRIDHPNIVEVYDCGHDPVAGYYVAMRFLEGQALADRIDNGPGMTILQSLGCFDAVLDACGAAHRAGVVHRDIKPDNIFLETDSREPLGFRTILLDFGLAKLMHRWWDVDSSASQRITRAALAMGTPGTMSPEQIRGEDADERSDIYSLGCVLYELLTGQQVFEVDSRAEMFRLHATHAPDPPSSRPGGQWIGPKTDELVLQMLAKSKLTRPADVGEVHSRFRRLRHQLETDWTSAHVRYELAGVSLRPNERLRSHLRATAPGVGTVLVVDDQPQIRRLVSLLLARNGYTVNECSSGEEALVWLGANPRPAGVVLDVMMPGMDGATCLAGMRSLGFAGPVVLCTSIESSQLPDNVRTAEGVAVVDKVGGLHELPGVLARLGGANADF